MINLARREKILFRPCRLHLKIHERTYRGREKMATPKITCDPNVLGGKPVVVGTRISVELILENLGAGETVEELIEAHPNLSPESIRAAIAFAARTMRLDSIYPTETHDA